MKCNGADEWSFRFLSREPTALTEPVGSYDEELEARPVEMRFKQASGEYDFARVTFSKTVAAMLESEIGPNGKFSGKTAVEVKYQGDVVHTLLFRPDWARFDYQSVTVQLKDLQKSLSSGNINIQKTEYSVENIYSEVLDQAPQNLINGYEFAATPSNSDENPFDDPLGDILEPGLVSPRNIPDFFSDPRSIYSDFFAIDIDDLTPEQAIQKLNKKFGLRTWINSEGTLVIGLPETDRDTEEHIAAPNDSRVWRYKEPNISYQRSPIKQVIAFGAWEDAAGLENPLDWFDEGGFADARVVGQAKRTDVTDGELIKVDAGEAKKGSVEDVARLQMVEAMKQQNSGRIEIDPGISGTRKSDPIDVKIGDLLQLVPDDTLFEDATPTTGKIGDPVDYPDKACGRTVRNESYVVDSIEHKINNNGAWEILLELSLYPNFDSNDIETSILYFDPDEEEYYSQEQFTSTVDSTKTLDNISNVLFEQV